jgi:hypothetical protein
MAHSAGRPLRLCQTRPYGSYRAPTNINAPTRNVTNNVNVNVDRSNNINSGNNSRNNSTTARPSTQPSNRSSAQQPATKPSTQPATRPSTQPSTTPNRSSTTATPSTRGYSSPSASPRHVQARVPADFPDIRIKAQPVLRVHAVHEAPVADAGDEQRNKHEIHLSSIGIDRRHRACLGLRKEGILSGSKNI